MKITTADLFNKTAQKISQLENISLEDATAIVNKHETFFVDMVEAFSEKDVDILAQSVLSIHFDEINN